MKKLKTTEQFKATIHFELNKSHQLPKKPFISDDPALILILHSLHGHEVVGAGRLDGLHNTHFMFKPRNCMNTHLEDWHRVARDDCSGFENLFTYLVATLDDFEKTNMIQLLTDLQTYDRKIHK